MTPPFTMPNTPNPSQGNNKLMSGTSAESTLAIKPNFPQSTSMSTGTQKQAPLFSPEVVPSSIAQNKTQTQSKPTAHDMIFSPVPTMIPPKPFMKASGPTSLGVIQDKQASPALIGQLVTIGTSNKTRKVLSIVIIALFVVLLIIAMIALMKTREKPSGSSSDQYHALATQVCTHERNVSFCVTPTPPNTHSRLWARRPGVPAVAVISERMVGAGNRHTARNYRDWLT